MATRITVGNKSGLAMISKMSYKKETSNHPNTAQWSQLQPIPTASQLDKAEDVTFLSFLFRR